MTMHQMGRITFLAMSALQRLVVDRSSRRCASLILHRVVLDAYRN